MNQNYGDSDQFYFKKVTWAIFLYVRWSKWGLMVNNGLYMILIELKRKLWLSVKKVLWMTSEE